MIASNLAGHITVQLNLGFECVIYRGSIAAVPMHVSVVAATTTMKTLRFEQLSSSAVAIDVYCQYGRMQTILNADIMSLLIEALRRCEQDRSLRTQLREGVL